MANIKENPSEDIIHIRSEILDFGEDGRFHLLEKKYGIKLLLNNRYFTMATDCFIYVFGRKYCWNIDNRIMKNFSPNNKIDKPEPLTLAVYGSTHSFDHIRHVGIVGPNLTVISKWGSTPVFEHPPEYVPISYGSVEYFRTDINQISEFCHPSLIKFLNLETSLPSVRQQSSKTRN